MIYCTTEHCSCIGIKQFSAGRLSDAQQNPARTNLSRPVALANGMKSRRACV